MTYEQWNATQPGLKVNFGLPSDLFDMIHDLRARAYAAGQADAKQFILRERLSKCLEVFEAQQQTGEFTVPPRQEFLQTLRDALKP